jgi:DNA repair protein RadA/Sms
MKTAELTKEHRDKVVAIIGPSTTGDTMAIIPVIEKDQSPLISCAAGVKITEPAADLAVLLSITSSLKNKPLPSKLIVFGEVGLAGEIRPAPRGQERLKEAAKLGFTRALIPEANRPKQAIPGMEVIAVKRVEEAVARIREME